MIYDINLIPKSRKKVPTEALFITTALFLSCTALLIFFGFYLPVQQKNTLREQIKEQENELLSYSDTQEQYIDLLNQVDDITQTDLTLNTLKSSKLKMTKIMNDIEKDIPKNIKINTMSLVGGLLTIEGNAPSYQDMAKYIVNLRKMESILDITFMNAVKDDTLQEVTIDEENLNQEAMGSEIPRDKEEEKKQVYNFTIYVNLNENDILSELLAQQANVLVNTGEEAVQDEIN